MLCLGNLEFGHFSLKEIGIDEGSFMPEMLRTSAEVFREVFLGLPLQQGALFLGNTVPELGLALMEVVDG